MNGSASRSDKDKMTRTLWAADQMLVIMGMTIGTGILDHTTTTQ